MNFGGLMMFCSFHKGVTLTPWHCLPNMYLQLWYLIQLMWCSFGIQIDEFITTYKTTNYPPSFWILFCLFFMSTVVLERVPDYPSFLPETDYFWATRTRLFRSGRYPTPTRTRLFEKTHTIWGKKCIIPDKISDFLGTRIRLFGIPTLPGPTRIRLFTIRSIRYPTFCYPLQH